MFEEIYRIIFDRRHIKDVRIWVLIVLLIAEVSSFFFYDKYRVLPLVHPIVERQEKQGKRIKDIIKVGKFRERISALTPDDPDDRRIF